MIKCEILVCSSAFLSLAVESPIRWFLGFASCVLCRSSFMEGPSFMAPQGDRTPYSGASSSKLKVRKGTVSGKRTATPYERPVVGRHASAMPAPLVHRQRGWTSEVVHSASRILTRSATFLFASLFKRQAPAITAAPAISEGDIEAPVPPLETVRPSGEVEILGDAEVGAERILERVSVEAADLENILKEKDLTREQCERYIKLIQSKYLDGESQRNATPQKLLTSNHEQHSDAFNLENQDSQPIELASVHVRKYSSQALVPVADRPARPRGVRFASTEEKREIAPKVIRAEHYTPIQKPIAGGREFLKSRATAATDSPLAQGSKDSLPTRSLNLRGPSIIPSANPKRKSNSETLDLTCFRKTKSRDNIKMDIPLVPGQSARTARKILDTLDRRPSFKEVRDPENIGKADKLLTRTPSVASTLKENSDDVRRTETTTLSKRTENVKSSSTSLHPLTSFATPSAFTFPSTGFASEPPTPKIPSPTSDDARANSREPQLKNGLILPLASWKDSSLDKVPSSSSLFGNGTTSFLGDNGFDFDKMAARAEKATSILDATFSTSPTLAASPSFSDKTSNHSSPGMMPAAFEPGSSSRDAQQQAVFPEAASGKQFGLFSSSTTATIGITAGQAKENSIFQASRSEQFSVGAESLAPPDTNSPNPSNGGFSVVEKTATRRKKSVKRMK